MDTIAPVLVMMTRFALLTACLVTLCLATAACADRRADKAYRRGDYETAARELRDLARNGEPRAQYDLALLYDKGQGVPQDDREALKWYTLAAEQGEPRAQYNLGLMYANGQGVQPDLVTAYYWISLAAAQGNQHALDARDYLSEKMTVEQITEGKRRVRDARAKK
jgi:TPR repeat protein